MNKFHFYKQLDSMDCAPTCLRMVSKFYGRSFSLDYLRIKSQYGKDGASLLGIAEAAESIGLKSTGAKLTFMQLIEDAPLPAILHWQQDHFVVLLPGSTQNKLMIADPANGIKKIVKKDFLDGWISTKESGEEKGIALLIEPTPFFYTANENESSIKNSRIGWSYLFNYLKGYQKLLIQIFLGLLLGSLLQLIFPYLTQSIVDVGINTQSLSFIQIVIAAQLMLLFSQTIVEFIRGRLLLYISTKVNVSLLSGFWAKLLKLPMNFFDTKHAGDILQRIGDHRRIESFLTGTALSTLFSVINLIIFSIVLLSYNSTIFLVYAVGSLLYLLWIQFYLKFRRRLDNKHFTIAAKENNATMQLVYGIQEIKLNNAENTFRWAWESLQAGLFKINFKSLSLSQYQQSGAFVIKSQVLIISNDFIK